jgi:DNA-binding HxlR family transcriptional regulator
MEDGTKNILGILCDTDDAEEMRRTFALVGDKWSLFVVKLLHDGPKRFSHLKREMGNVTQRMLTRSLRQLERDGLIVRTVFPTTPPSVEYALTASGATLSVAIEPLMEWSRSHRAALTSAREHYDLSASPVAEPGLKS